MIVVDTSVLVALLMHEPDAPILKQRLENAKQLYISIISVVEATMVIQSRKGDNGVFLLDRLIDALDMRIESVDATQLSLLRAAHHRYGKGRGHPAQLNFGDCFSYALAKAMQLPLLFKGEDFRHTDIMAAE